MSAVTIGKLCAVSLLAVSCGCRGSAPHFASNSSSRSDASVRLDRTDDAPVRPASYEKRAALADQTTVPPAPTGGDEGPPAIPGLGIDDRPPLSAGVEDPILARSELEIAELVREVLARNPSVQAAVAGWQAAARKYPQAISLDDPMLQTMAAPGSWGNDMVDPAYAFQVGQKFPWHGKRALRGDAARAQARESSYDVPEAELRLTEAARLAYLEYYLSIRLTELNKQNIRAVKEFREAADAKYQANQVTQQDVLQADVELATLAKRRVELERARRVAIARINTLLHRLPDCHLPPPAELPEPPEVLPAAALRQLAIERRPDLASISAQIQEQRAKIALACREFYPDVEIFGRYDTFWQEDPLRTQIGANVNLPIYRDRRVAAVDEEALKLRQRRAEYQYQVDLIHNEVQSAYERVIESQQVADLYRTRIVPAAEQNVESARAGYVAAKVDFLRLIEAQRQLIELQQQAAESQVELLRRIAECERAVGGRIQNESDLGRN